MAVVASKTSPGWAKIKFLYAYAAGFELTADSEATGYEVGYMLNRLEGNYWLSTSTATQYINDTGSAGSGVDVDYLILYGHNLFTAGATVTLQYSSDNFSSDVNDAFTGEVPANDEVFFKTFASINADYWRLKISGATAEPKITIGYWGVATELEHCTTSFDPNAQRNNAIVNRSETGYVVGVYETFTERTQSFTWSKAELDIYDKLSMWFDTIGKQNFFVAWDSDNHPTEVFLMYADGNFNCPYSQNGQYRDLSVVLTGRKV